MNNGADPSPPGSVNSDLSPQAAALVHPPDPGLASAQPGPGHDPKAWVPCSQEVTSISPVLTSLTAQYPGGSGSTHRLCSPDLG